ncbi:hypothetical protein HN451_11320 [archaeon]|jgi:hypothetical protein|nr:hypothetical protein [archaeon]
MKTEKSLIIGILILSLFGGVTGLSDNPYYYDFEMNYNQGDMDISSISIEFYEDVIWNLNNPEFNLYYLEIVDFRMNVLETINFSVPNFRIKDYIDEDGNFSRSELVELEDVSFNVFVSYYSDAYEVVIYDSEGVEVDREFLSQFSRTGFDISDFSGVENSGIDNRVTDEQEGDIVIEDEGFVNKFNNSDYKMVIISLIVILIALVVVWVVSVKKKWK